MNKKLVDEKSVIDLRAYYKNLGRKNRGNFLRFLVTEYGMGYSTIINKLNGRLRMTKTDIFLLNLATKNELLWKQ